MNQQKRLKFKTFALKKQLNGAIRTMKIKPHLLMGAVKAACIKH
jgi:hypothetical protein